MNSLDGHAQDLVEARPLPDPVREEQVTVRVAEEEIVQVPGTALRVARAEIELLEARDVVHADQGCFGERVTIVLEVSLDDVGAELREGRRGRHRQASGRGSRTPLG